ncbi:MAG: EpsG family protein [Rubrivivax sp.]
MDDLILGGLYVYGVMLFAAVLRPPVRNLAMALAAMLPLRLFCLGLRISLGSDVPAYTTVLQQCDLSAINALELFWPMACLPSAYLSDLFPFPFFWIGLIDCVLFALIARLGGLRIAALHDLVYLLSTSMGAIRQALAMKLVLLAVLLYVANRKKRGRSGGLLVLTAPFVHLAAVVPAAAMKFMTSGLLVRLVLIAAPLLLGSMLIDEALLSKLMFYMQFEGFRSAQEIYASWAKRFVVIAGSLTLTAPNGLYWGVYSIGMVFAAAEFQLPEIAVRVGAYFEQFEVLLIGAPMKPHLRRLGILWYGLIALAYTARYMINIAGLPR